MDENTVSQVNYETRINKVLEKLLDPKFKLRNDVYLNSLLSYFVGKTENKFYNSAVFMETFLSWIITATSQWEKKPLPSPDIFVFALNLTSFISKEEIIFVRLNSQELYERLLKLIQSQEYSTAPSVKLAYINMLSSFLEHKSGKQWIIATNYWTEILGLTLRSETHYISKEGCKFLIKLLSATIKLNERFCVNVIQMVLEPLVNFKPTQSNILCQAGNNLVIQDQAIYQSLCATITLTTELLEKFLENIGSKCSRDIFNLFVEKFQLENLINNVLMVAQSEDFVYDLNRVLCILALYEILVKLEGMKTVSYEQAFPHIKKLFKILMDNIQKGYVANVLKLCYMTQIYYKSISNYMPVCTKKEKDILLFENQIMLMQITPVFVYGLQITNLSIESFEEKFCTSRNDIREMYALQFWKKMGVACRTIRIFWAWRDVLLGHTDLPYITLLSLTYLSQLHQYINRDSATMIFELFVYSLKDYVDLVKEDPKAIHNICEDINIKECIMDNIHTYLQNFEFSWLEAIGTISLMDIALDYLCLYEWMSYKLVVKALKLVDISIKKYMTPNMALLVDRTNDSTLALVGPLLYAKLHDSTWEVRDSALEVICTLAYNANTRFPSFQKIILDAEIVPLVVKMALNDGESYVRATALKCLQEIIQVSDFWEKLLSVDNLHEDLLAILQKEPEGLVRQEGATLISKIYEHQTFPDTLLPEVFDVMSHAATSDLHWEVKVNALNFWENVINNHLQHQGMIDGSFPNVTFSKEHKKIVTLNEAEVKKRLIKVLHQLSNVGCLSVLVTAVQDDCDVEVAKAATKITKNFVELLQKYNVDSTSCKTSESSTPVTTPTEELPFSPMLQSENFCNTPMSTDQTDRIIDEIINTRDEMLLVTVCNPSDQPMSADLPKISGKKICLPSEFVKFSYDDLESYETEKRKWLNNIDDFGSLLDDILREYNDSDVNSMDCY